MFLFYDKNGITLSVFSTEFSTFHNINNKQLNIKSETRFPSYQYQEKAVTILSVGNFKIAEIFNFIKHAITTKYGFLTPWHIYIGFSLVILKRVINRLFLN